MKALWRRNKIKWRALGLPLICLVGFAGYAQAESQLQRYRVSLYLLPYFNYNIPSGDKFDGNWTLTGTQSGTTEILVIPKVNDALGYGGAAGVKVPVGMWPVDAAFEIGYSASEPKVSFMGASGDASQRVLDFNLKVLFRSGKRLQPGIQFGYHVPTLTVKDGVLSSGGRNGDAKYYGNGYSIGGNISYYVHQNVSLDWSLAHRWYDFNEAEGVLSRAAITNPLKASSLGAQISITFHWGWSKLEY